MATRRALVIGGSLGGLLAANLLRHAGWQKTIRQNCPAILIAGARAPQRFQH